MDELKSRFDALFTFVSQVEYSRTHPIRVVQACKSLVGINPENPPKVLLRWLERYLKCFNPSFNKPASDINEVSPEVITYSHLGNLIINKKQKEAYNYLGYLLQITGPNHIAEFLIELAASKSSGSLLFCWSAMRSIQFVGEQEGYPILYHCISRLLKEEEVIIESDGSALERYEICCHQFQIRESEMVRMAKIIPYFDQLIKTIESNFIQSEFPDLPEKLKKMINQEGIRGIHAYLNGLKLEGINFELVLLLDALRSVLQFSGLSLDKILSGMFIKSGKDVNDE